MKARIAIGFVVLMFVMTLAANADGKAQLQKHFSDAAAKVKATDSPAEKRAILNESFETMSKALDMVQRSPLISQEDAIAIGRFKAVVQEKKDELLGDNGYTRVSDAQLDAFANFVVQDMEQAAVTIVISLLALVLVVILILILL